MNIHPLIYYLECCVIALILPGQRVLSEQLVPSDIVSGFDELEIESIDSSIAFALDTLSDSATHMWVSSGNKASGHIKLLRSFEFDASMCREIEIVSSQVGFTAQRRASFCQGDDLFWHRLNFKLKKPQ